MKKYINQILVFIVITTFVALFVLYYFYGFIDPANKNTVVKLYFADNITFAHEKVIQEFNHKYKDEIQVIPVNLPFDKFTTNERKELLSRSLRNKNKRIDVLAIDYIWVPRFAKWAEPLDEYITSKNENFLHASLEACTYNNSIIGLPLYIDIGLMFYRKDLLQHLPDYKELEHKLKSSITWEDFVSLKKSINIENPFYVFPAYNYEGLVCSFMETLAGLDSSLIRQSPLDFNKSNAFKGLNLLVDLVHTYKLSPPEILNFKEQSSYRYSLENDALFFRGWPGNMITFREEYPDIVKNIGIAALPHFTGHKPTFVYGGWNLMIAKKSDKKEQAFKFISFMIEKENQKYFFKENGFLPTNANVYNDAEFIADYPELSYYHKLLSMGFHRPKLEDYTMKSDIISYYLNKAIKKEISVSEALQFMNERMESQKVFIH